MPTELLILWDRSLAIALLIGAAGVLLWAFHKEIEDLLFTKREYISVRLVGVLTAVFSVLVINTLGLVLIPSEWIVAAVLQTIVFIGVAILRESARW